ncbi:MAG: discoidin domain-containing protein [Planctomycetes bacterium]|nr:discoidin domain-containing protein [Planctomycetota bacterium]
MNTFHIRFIVTFLLILFAFSGTIKASLVNVAPQATVTASHPNASGSYPQNLVDGNYSNLGSQIYGQHSGWWEFDLGQEHTIIEARYYGAWHHPNPNVDYRFSEYKIEAKNNYSDDWSTIVHMMNNESQTNFHSFSPVSAQYWRMNVIHSNYVGPYWNEFELLAGEPVPEPGLLSLLFLSIGTFGFMKRKKTV